jgi:hypothetical protein
VVFFGFELLQTLFGIGQIGFGFIASATPGQVRNIFRAAPSGCDLGLQQEVLLEHGLQLFRVWNSAMQLNGAPSPSHSSGTSKEAA